MDVIYQKITQSKLEAFANIFEAKNSTGRTRSNGAMVRTAIQAGWLELGEYTPKPESWKYDGEEVGDMEGWFVEQLSDDINEHYKELMTVPLAFTSTPQPMPKAS